MRRPPTSPTSLRRGFTLLELLVVSVLMIMVTMGMVQLWRYFSVQMANVRQRATASQELKFALEVLRRDMGELKWATPIDQGRLVVCKTAPDGQETVVEYSLEQRNLVRYDQSTHLAIPVAADVSSFLVEDVDESILRMVITVSCGPTTRQASLFWSRS